MVFTDLRLQQYRSYSDSSFELGEGVNIVVGPNAAGKTNLLEAIMVNSIGRSYRAKDVNLVQYDKAWARIDIHTSENSIRTVKLQTDAAGKVQKTFEVDEKPYKKLLSVHRQPIVLFEPNDLQLIESDPTHRRSYFDDIIEQYEPRYEQFRNHYKRVVSQRNSLLKQLGKPGGSQLFAWNLRLVDLGERLVKQRLELLTEINEHLSETYSKIAGSKTNAEIRYETSIDTKDYGTNLLKKLESSESTDRERGFTGNGPHRDDFMVYINKTPAIISASRGEIRTLLLALKIIELKILERERGLRPLLLLDDVFSELDGARRRALIKYLKNYQTMITTTDADAVIQNFVDDYTVLPI